MPRFKPCISVVLSTLLLISIGAAQYTPNVESNSRQAASVSVITGIGVKNYIPIWTSSASLSNSAIYQSSGGNVGVGTTTPAATLDVNGSINAANSYEIGGSTVLYTGSPSLSSIFVGQGAGSLNSAGNENSFVGYWAGHANVAGGGNSFFGYEAGWSNTTGGSNAFFGTATGSSNTSGNYNAFFGWLAGATNSTGQNNSFFGTGAGSSNTTGSSNVAVGANSGGSDNTNLGANVFVGVKAGFNNSSGGGNTIIGFSAGVSNTIGSYNVFYGYGAGAYNSTGSNNVYLAAPGVGTESNTIRIGSQGTGQNEQNTTYMAGIYGTAVSGIPVYIAANGQLGTLPSSRRFKEQIRDMDDSSSNLLKLRPVTFLYRADYERGLPSLQYGLIAEEVADVYPELVSYDAAGKPYAVRYQYLDTMLLNEMQKQYHRAEVEATVISEQEQKIAELEKRLSRLELHLFPQATAAVSDPLSRHGLQTGSREVTLPIQSIQ